MGAGRWLSTHGTQVLVSTQLLGSKRGTTLLNSSSPGLLLTLLRVALGGGESMPYIPEAGKPHCPSNSWIEGLSQCLSS